MESEKLNHPWYDAHNHLQNPRLEPYLTSVLRDCRQVGIQRMIVNGTRETDWVRVAKLAVDYPDMVIPAFGYHPWWSGEHHDGWEKSLRTWLTEFPMASVGEIGLDRWILESQQDLYRAPASTQPASIGVQTEQFLFQMNLAVELDRPVSIHCLKAWGLLLDLLSSHRLPTRGFLLHSYGGPKELIGPLADLGAYFGFPGYFLQIKKQRQREVFRSVPKDRLLVETDAPDQPLPDCWIEFPSWKPSISSQPLTGHSIHNSSIPSVETRVRSEPENSPWNHPANLRAVYRGLAEWLGISTPELAETVRDNFERLFISGFRGNPNAVRGKMQR